MLAVVVAPHGFTTARVSEASIVPRASHRRITPAACPGRVLGAEPQVRCRCLRLSQLLIQLRVARPFPNRAGYFHSTRLSRDVAPPVLGLCDIHRTRWVLSTFPCTPSPCIGRYPDHLSTMSAQFPCGSHRVGNPIVSRLRWSVFRLPRSLGSPISSGSRSVVSSLRSWWVRRDHCACPLVPCWHGTPT